MKSIQNILLFMLLTSLSFGYAQVYETDMYRPPISFRSQALGGTIYDDLDLVYDPIELRFVDGARVYTNLSNLTSNEEQILNNMSDDEFLFGTSWKNRFVFDLWTSFLVRYQKSRFSNPVAIDGDLSGFDDIFGDGNLSNIYNALLDVTGDGLYDIKNTISQEKTDIAEDQMRMIILNNSLLYSGWTFGLQLIHGKESDEGSTSSGFYGRNIGLFGADAGEPTLSLNYDHYLVPDNFFRDFHQKETGDFLTKNEHTFTHIYFATMRPFDFIFVDSVEMRLDFGYMKENMKSDINDEYGGRIQYFDQDINDYLELYTENEKIVQKNKEDGNGFLVGLSAKRVFQKGLERKNNGFWQVRVGWNHGSFDYEENLENPFTSEEDFFDGFDTLSIDFNRMVNEKMLITDKGDGIHNHYFASGLISLPLGERVHAGIGTTIALGSMDRNTKYLYDFRGVEDYEEFDAFNSNDYQLTITEGQEADRTYEFNYYHFRFPVGIEYKFTCNKKWSLRFGSIFNYYRTEMNDAFEITNSQPHVETQEFRDGTVAESIDDNINQSVSSHQKDAESNTTFVYGLGFNPTANLQVDLLGFLGSTDGEQIFDTTFYRKLRLSFTLKL